MIFMETEKRRAFIINFFYFAILLTLAFVVLKYGLPLISPFVIAFFIAYVLKRPICFLADKLPIHRKLAALVMVLLFYSIVVTLLILLGAKAFSGLQYLIMNLPRLYTTHVGPMLTGVIGALEQSVLGLDPAIIDTIRQAASQFVESLGQMVSGLSFSAMGLISNLASSLPGMLIKLLLMVIASFFIAMDYEKLTGFCMAQLNDKTKKIFIEIKEYVVGTLFVCIRSYALIMTITFVELAIGLLIIRIDNAIFVAFLIAIFDILPILGTGGIMIPWTIITAIQGNYPLAFGLLAVYIIITVIRNIIEPKIVGSQIGLHPVVTLISIFVGAQLFGVLGLFGLPILLSLLRHLNETGTIRLFKMPDWID